MQVITFKRLFGRVDRSMYEALEKKLHTLAPETCLVLIFNSSGGDLEYARKMCSLLYRISKEKNITTVGFGYHNVHSAALRVFMQCHYRMGLKGTKYLIHLPEDISYEIDDQDVVRIGNEEIDFFVGMTGASHQMMKQLFFQGVYLNSLEAARLGVTNFIDYQRSQKPFLSLV